MRLSSDNRTTVSFMNISKSRHAVIYGPTVVPLAVDKHKVSLVPQELPLQRDLGHKAAAEISEPGLWFAESSADH